MTAAWVDDVWLALDTETTGVDVYSDRIVEVAVVEIHPDGTLGDSYATIVNPGVEIPDGAAKVHGITTARARDEGITPANALASVAARIFAHGYRPVIGFNMVFDWPICISEAERHGIEFPAVAPILDPFRIDHLVDRYRKGSRKLIDVAHHYAVELDEADAHGALADAVAAARVMRAIVARHPQVGERSLASVYLRQVRGHELWRDNFVDYKRRSTGDPTFDIDPGWPIPARINGGLPVVTSTPAPEPPAGADVGEGVATNAPAATPKPPAKPGVTAKDVAILAGKVFATDGDKAPPRQKTRTIERLRHALTYVATGGEHTSLRTLDDVGLLHVDMWLRHVRDGLVTYATDDEGVTFVLMSSGKEAAVAWALLETTSAA